MTGISGPEAPPGGAVRKRGACGLLEVAAFALAGLFALIRFWPSSREIVDVAPAPTLACEHPGTPALEDVEALTRKVAPCPIQDG